MGFSLSPVERFAQWLTVLSVAEWAALLVGALLLLGVVRQAWALLRGQPGPVEISTFADGGDAPARLSALVRERVSETRLYPAPVPTAGTPELANVVSVSPLPQAKFIGAVLAALRPILRGAGHRVAGTAWAAGGESGQQAKAVGVALEITDERTGQLETAVVVTRASAEEAAQAAAAEIYGHVFSHPRVKRRQKPWRRWSSTRAVEAFERGLKFEQEHDSAAAYRAYSTALRIDPGNGLARFRLAALLEAASRLPTETAPEVLGEAPLLEALGLYADTVSLWPGLWEARYRLAALCSFERSWRAFLASPAGQAVDARADLVAIARTSADASNPEIVRALLQRAKHEWPVVQQTARGPYASAAAVACLCTEVQLASARDPVQPQELRALVQKSRRSTARHVFRSNPARYNMACFYSLAIHPSLRPDECRELALGAIRHLDRLVRATDLDFAVIEFAARDDDLENVAQWIATNEEELSNVPSLRFWHSVFAA